MSEEVSKSAAASKAQSEPGRSPGGGSLPTFTELEQHFERLKSLHAQTTQREAELTRLAAEIERRTRETESRAADLEAKVKAIEADRAKLEQERQALQALREELDEAKKSCEGDRRTLEGERRAAAESSSRLEALSKELEQRRATIASQEEAVRAQSTALEGERRRLEEASAALAKDRAAVEKLRSEQGATRAEQDERDDSLQLREAALAAAQNALARKHAEVDAARKDLEKRRASLDEEQKKVADDHRELASTQQRLAQMMKAVQARAAELEEREKALASREQDRLAHQAAAAELEGAADAQVKKLEAALADRAAMIAARDNEVARLRAETERLASELGAAQAAAKKAAQQRPAAPAPTPETDAELDKSRRAIELLAEKLRAAQRENEQLRARLEQQRTRHAGAAPATAPGRFVADPHNALRLRRLQKYKTMLQTQARKIMTAQAALNKRQSEAEQILAHRAKLASAAEHIREREARLTAQRSNSAGATIALSVAVTVSSLAAISWFAAMRLAPATFLSSADIEADSRGRQASNADLEGWQNYHNQLVTDPQIVAQAAERVGQRGISELSDSAALQFFLKNNLTSDSSRNGQLLLHLKGPDAERTCVILDTVVTTIAASANATRTQRPDGLVSEITTPPATATDPVEDQRVEYAAGIFGGSSFLSFLLGCVVRQRVARSRRRASGDDAMATFLDENNWPKMQA